jgi:hypothetical protein
LNITIHNLYSDLKLTSPVYCSNSTVCHVSPSQQVDTNNALEASFGITFRQKYFKGALLYKLQRHHTTETDNQPSTSTASVEDTTTNLHLLVVWNVEDDDRKFCVCLIECTGDFTWDEDKLWALWHQYNNNQFYENYKSRTITWLMNGGTIMKTRYDVAYGSDYKLDIVVSEGTRIYNMKEPIEIDPKRLVLPLSILTVLIYTVRLLIPLSFKLNIHNQCSNVDLTSPVYITDDKLECHRPPDHKVNVGGTMRSGFIICSSDYVSYGVLIYRLQRKQSHEYIKINEYASRVFYLLVVWSVSESNKLYTDVLLVEHDEIFERFDWNEDNLGELYHKNINQFRLFLDSVTETWLLDDNVALMSTFEIMNENRILDITISEVKEDSDARTPVHINLEV